MDWTKYLSESDTTDSESRNLNNQMINNDDIFNEDGITEVGKEIIKNFCENLSGKNIDDLSNSIISYQTFEYYDENDTNRDIIYTLSKGYCEFTYNAMNPEFAILDIIFPSYDEPELKLMWARLQKWKNSIGELPVFIINLLQRDSITLQTETNDLITESTIFNPIMFYLTRETPTTMASDEIINGEICGGNVIRLLLNMSLVTFERHEDVNSTRSKAELLREIENEEYLNHQEEIQDTDIW